MKRESFVYLQTLFEKQHRVWSAFGWIITKKGIEDMKCRAEKETEDQARKMEEFTECVFI